ncbi:hypothetical protein PHLCEN_2v3957 [Hermanssonia centrifuga]|uniref:Uncharacterized protein n=1 Tax=Hermanssonia centrifuga TaxID=98765 RepID=A0A2R6Q7P6_9APHY|nr:hypothetical protein PHLCEN_2v3957 [Hermanssonia centrifuga]
MSQGTAQPAYPDAWINYKKYLSETSVLIPLPPALYRPLPGWIKRTVLLDWGMYRFDEATDGKRALKESDA